MNAAERWGFALYRNGKPERRVLNLSYEVASSKFEDLVLREQDSRNSNVQLLVRRSGRARYEAIVQAVGRRLIEWRGSP